MVLILFQGNIYFQIINQNFKIYQHGGSCIKFDEKIPDVFVDPNLFISKNLHLVTYPIRDNSILNCVLIAKDIDKK